MANGGALLLFDIDGTLVRDAEAEHFDAMYEAINRVFGIAPSGWPQIERAGRTDLEIARLTLAELDVPSEAIETGLVELRVVWPDVYEERCPPSLSDRVVPGILDVLGSLRSRRATLGLLTGNLEPIARLKLDRAGLGQFFGDASGAFGSDAEDRRKLPDVARREAGQATGRVWPRADTILIGDTPLDIEAARYGGIRCIAVATGSYDPWQLREAEVVTADAFELEDVLQRLTEPLT